MLPLFVLAQEGWNWFGFGMGMGVVALLVSLAAVVIWVWGLIDAATNPALDGAAKIVWLLLIFFLPVVGTIAYMLMRPSPTMGAGPGGTLDRRL